MSETQHAEGKCYYNEIVREKFILCGKLEVYSINLSPKWAPSVQGIPTLKFKIIF